MPSNSRCPLLFRWRDAVTASSLHPTDRLVALALSMHMSRDGTGARVSAPELARLIGSSERTARRHLRRLVEAGWLTARPREDDRGGTLAHEFCAVDQSPPPRPRRPGVVATHLPPPGVNRDTPQGFHAPSFFSKDTTTPPYSPPTGGATETSEAPMDQDPLPLDVKPVPPTDLERFDEFWAAFPRHVAKGAARKAWRTALRLADADTLIAGAQRYAADPNRDPAFTCHASTWLRAERWEDEPLPARHRRTSLPSALAELFS